MQNGDSPSWGDLLVTDGDAKNCSHGYRLEKVLAYLGFFHSCK